MAKRRTASEFAESFWARVQPNGGCREWVGARDGAGYGVVRSQGRNERTHRVAWTLSNGPIPEGRLVCHTCDNPPCCDPLHLFLGSSLDNSRDAQQKGRTGGGGRGHIRPYRGDGWRVYVYAGSDALTGKPRQLTKVVAGTRKDAERVLTAMLASVDQRNGRRVGTNAMTLGDLLEAFIDHKTLSVEMSTADSYRDQLVYIPARLRDMPLGKIDVETLEGLYADLCRRGRKRTVGGLSPRTVRKVHIVIHGAFELARRRRWVTVNPAADAEVPSVPRRLPTPAPSGAVGELLRAAASIHHALPLYLQVTVCVGGRRSEVHGLRWSSIDFARAVVVLRDAVVFAGGEWRVKPYTKTGGQRTIRIDQNTLAKLEALHDRAFTDAMICNVALPAEAFVFSDAAVGDRPWKPRTTLDRFQRACVAAGLDPKTRLHDLRSLMATHLIDEGIPVPVVSARLGHAQNSTTLDIYTGRIAASDAAAAEVMGHLFDGNGRLTG